MFYLMTHSTHFIYGYMASKICLDDGGPSSLGSSGLQPILAHM